MWLICAKFHNKEILESLQSGCIYMNPVSYFKKVDYSKPHVFDPFEGTNCYIETAKVKLIQSKKLITEMFVKDVAITYGDSNQRSSHIWCCFHIKNGMCLRGDQRIFSEEMWNFGDNILIIRDFDEFAKRIINSVRQHDLNCNANSVNYINKYCGTRSIKQNFHFKILNY